MAACVCNLFVDNLNVYLASICFFVTPSYVLPLSEIHVLLDSVEMIDSRAFFFRYFEALESFSSLEILAPY